MTKIADASIGDGALQISGLTSRSRVRQKGDGFATSSRARIAELRIGGVAVPLDPGAGEQTLPIPGVGTLTFNLSRERTTKRFAVARTEVLRVDLSDGTRIQLGRSKARLDDVPDGIFRGGAWGTEADALGVVGSGRTGFVPMPCAGTGGKVQRNDTVRADLAPLVSAAATDSRVRTFTRRDGKGVGVASARLAGIELGDGAIQVDALRAKARVVRGPKGAALRKAPFSRVGTLTAGGEVYALPLDGQTLEIPGLASIQSGVVERNKRGLKVVALRVTLLEAAGDQPVVVDVGVAAVYTRR